MKGLTGRDKQIAQWLALLRVPGIGIATLHRLVRQYTPLDTLFSSPEAAPLSARSRLGLTQINWDKIAEEIAWYDADDKHILLVSDPDYPPLLREINDPPPLLFVYGDKSTLLAWQLAIVGSRNPTVVGKKQAYEFAKCLVQTTAITSGLAIGIDAAAHQGALAGNGATVAVVGTGLDTVYPAQHRRLVDDIIAQGGAIVSEFMLGSTAKAAHFPRRNRIISGLSLGCLVVEAALQSGSLITARMAMEQGREVFAMPGSIHNPLSRGGHQLIKNGAKLVETAMDILEELGSLAAVDDMIVAADDTGQAPTGLDTDYQQLLDHMGYDPIAIDDLTLVSGLTVEATSSMLLLLELQGLVTALSGGRYMRLQAS